MGEMQTVTPWMVRIVDGGGSVRGAGILVSPGEVLTCAHVMAPGAGATFADSLDAAPVGLSIVAEAFIPAAATWHGDVALVELAEPQTGRETASLRRFPLRTVTTYHAYGFPADYPHGVWAVTTPVGEAGPGWVQLDQKGGATVRRGFSGSGVRADPFDQLVGMMVAAHEGDRQSFMLPAETIHDLLGDRPWLTGESALPRPFSEKRLPSPPSPDALRELNEVIAGLSGTSFRVFVLGAGDAGRSAALHQAVLDTPGVDFLVDCAGRSVDEIEGRLAARAAVDRRDLYGDRAPQMTVVLHRVDLAAQPLWLLRHVVVRLSARHDVLATFVHARSDVLAEARQLQGRRSAGGGELIGQVRLAERAALSLHRRAARAVLGLPPVPDRYPELRRRFDELRARADGDLSREAAALRAEAEAATRAALAVHDRLGELLERHRVLRSRLTSYFRMAAGYGHAEDERVTVPYRAAYTMLHDGPADLDEAEAAVTAFGAVVRGFRP